MKIIIISSYYDKGGAARAALRLANALAAVGVNVEYKSIYPRKLNLISKINYYCRVMIDRLLPFLIARKKQMFSIGMPSNSALVKFINNSDANVVHLHWINGGALSIADLAKINKPIIWSLHDMWPFTGGCHYDNNCNRYMTGCGSCPLIASSNTKDISHYVINKKTTVYNAIQNISIVGVSRWMANCASSSLPMNKLKISSLPNPIDTTVFFPLNKASSRSEFKLPEKKKLILFGAVAAIGDIRKGYAELIEALNFIENDGSIQLVVFGGERPKGDTQFRFESHFLGHINDDAKLQRLYSTADVMIVPSIQEAFGQTATESMACGTPVVAFGATGLLDIIDHEVNGYLAKPYNPQSLADGISWILNSPDYENICKNARDKIVRTFDHKVVAEQYKELYVECLAQCHPLISEIDSSEN